MSDKTLINFSGLNIPSDIHEYLQEAMDEKYPDQKTSIALVKKSCPLGDVIERIMTLLENEDQDYGIINVALVDPVPSENPEVVLIGRSNKKPMRHVIYTHEVTFVPSLVFSKEAFPA